MSAVCQRKRGTNVCRPFFRQRHGPTLRSSLHSTRLKNPLWKAEFGEQKFLGEANAMVFGVDGHGCGGADLNRRPLGYAILTHLSIRVGLYLHPLGVLAIQSLRLPRSSGAWFGIAVSLARLRFHRL